MPDPIGEIPKPSEQPKGPDRLPPQKEQLVRQAMGRFDFIEDSTRQMKLQNTAVGVEVSGQTRGLQMAVDNARPNEPGIREMRRPTEETVRSVRDGLARMSGDLETIGAKQPSDRAAIEDIINRAAREQDHYKAFELAQAAVAKFRSVSREVEEISGGQKATITQVSGVAGENNQRIRRIGSQIGETIRKDIRETEAGEIVMRSGRLTGALEDAKSKLSAQDSKFLDESSQNQKDFEQIVQEIIKEETTPHETQPPKPSASSGSS